MPSITPAEVKKIAKLSRLALTDSEVEAATKDLTGILDNFSAVQAIDTSAVATSDNVTGLQNITRPDVARPNVLADPADLLAAAPETKDGYIKVKAVFE